MNGCEFEEKSINHCLTFVSQSLLSKCSDLLWGIRFAHTRIYIYKSTSCLHRRCNFSFLWVQRIIWKKKIHENCWCNLNSFNRVGRGCITPYCSGILNLKKRKSKVEQMYQLLCVHLFSLSSFSFIDLLWTFTQRHPSISILFNI